MKWSWKIVTISKINVYIHDTFLLRIGWGGFTYWQGTQTWLGALEGIFFTLVFLAVLFCIR